MPMRIVCPHCGKQFSAWDDLVGKAVECPKCHQKTVVAGPNTALEPAAPVPPAGKMPAAPRPKPPVPPASRPHPAGPSPGAAAGTTPGARSTPTYKPIAPKPPAPPAAPRAPHPVPPGPASHRPASTVEDEDDSLPLGCPHCNATMAPNDDLCDACGYHLILKKVIDISDMPKRNRATGFERVFQEQLHDPESASNTLLWIKILGTLFLLVVLFVCLGRWWWVGVLAAAGLGVLYWTKVRQQSGGESGADINRDPISRLIWTVILSIQRVMGWRKLEWPFPKARSLVLCDPAFQDDELEKLERLNELEAMDLEGTGITDGGLEYLRPMKQLRFLVLRRTQVTAGGARRLQEDLPKTLIWY